MGLPWASMAWFWFGVKEQWQSDELEYLFPNQKTKLVNTIRQVLLGFFSIHIKQAGRETKCEQFNFRVAKSCTPKNSGCF